MNEYVSGIVAEIMGIIITVVFVQSMFENKSKYDKKDDELEKIIRTNKGYYTAGQAPHPPPTAAFRGKLRGIKPFVALETRFARCGFLTRLIMPMQARSQFRSIRQ